MVTGKLSQRGEVSTHSQAIYHRALNTLHPAPELEIIQGRYSLEPSSFYPYQSGQPIQLNQPKVSVWRPEEKQTDVNIALHMYRDVVMNACDAQILFSNDTDLSPALCFVREYSSNINIGLVIPKKPSDKRTPNRSSSDLSDWQRRHITDTELSDCQMPSMVPTQRKPAIKPSHWWWYD